MNDEVSRSLEPGHAYGPSSISGQARVVLGNVYINNNPPSASADGWNDVGPIDAEAEQKKRELQIEADRKIDLLNSQIRGTLLHLVTSCH